VELVKAMARHADVMIENFAPGAVDRLGLGPDVIRALNPSIIYCQVKGFGTGSPYEKSLAFDMIAQAAGGLMSVTGDEDGLPCKAGATVGDTGTGMVMAISILGAYVRRLRTGQGEHLQVAMQDAVMHYIRNAFTVTERTGGKPAPRAGSRTIGGGNPPIGVYPCKGGGPNDYVYIFTSRANPEHWTRLLKVMGREDLIGDPRYATPEARTERREEVDAIVSAWTRQHDKHQAMRLVSLATVPAGRARHGRAGRRPHVPGPGHSPDHAPPDGGRVRHERVASPLRRPDASARAGAVARPARRGGPRRVAEDGQGRDRRAPQPVSAGLRRNPSRGVARARRSLRARRAALLEMRAHHVVGPRRGRPASAA
jgi:crotonobetainyl-CoA:carnitine CoA-transferase CaiB-like acyl-CoA transferase